jgi:chemotaxis protein CheD
VLGSCVSVALFDAADGVGGMNHFMLPAELGSGKIFVSKSGKYGMYAMELLINEMIKLGGEKRNFIAKVFGGGKVLKTLSGAKGSISENNVLFAMKYLEEEKIPVSSSDVGGYAGRRILFFTKDARVLLKRLTPSEEQPVEKEEEDYYTRIHGEERKADVTLF